MADDPADPVSPLALAATQAHEMFMTLVNSNFTESQALYLVGVMLTRSGGPPS
jgi:hypothetical protein